jgi:hypothetical protein
MAPYRNSPPPDWGGWGDDALYSSRHDPLSGGYPPDGDYAELMAPDLSAPPRSTTPFGQFLPSLLDAVARLPKPVPPGRFLPSIGFTCRSRRPCCRCGRSVRHRRPSRCDRCQRRT